jgi:hypothetical protein
MSDPDPNPFADCDAIVCYGNAKPTDTHLASVIHCIDGEIIGWLERQERRRRDTRKSRQGFPWRLVPLHLRRGTVSSGARTQPVLALIWTHATFNEAVGALPVCRANDPRSLWHVTGGDALQASTAVPFDEMAKARFLIERPAIIIAD